VYQFACTELKAPDKGLWVLTMELASCHLSGTMNWKVVPRFLEWLFGVQILVETIDAVLSKMSRPTVGHMQTPTQWVPGFCRNCKGTGLK